MADKFSPTKPEAEFFFPGFRPPSPPFVANCLVLLAVSCNLLFTVSCSPNKRPGAVTYPAYVRRETKDNKTHGEPNQGDPQPGSSFVSVVQPSEGHEGSEIAAETVESSRRSSDRRQNDKRAPEHEQHIEHKEHRAESKADLPELRLIYSYSNPEHNLEARVFFQSAGGIGCASRQITKHFARRKVTETKNQCFKKNIWKKVEEKVKSAGLFSSKSKYRCKNPGERRAAITLSVLEKTRSITIGPICEDERDDLPDSLNKLLAFIQKLTLTLR